MDFLSYSSSDSDSEFDKDSLIKTNIYEHHINAKKKSQQVQPSKMFSTNGPYFISVHEGKMQLIGEKCNATFVKKIELEKHV